MGGRLVVEGLTWHGIRVSEEEEVEHSPDILARRLLFLLINLSVIQSD